MGQARIVLDTNVFRGGNVDVLANLHARGYRISVSQIAYVETWAHSAAEHRKGMPREQARGKFFGRARSIARYIDDEEPIALAGGLLSKRIESAVSGAETHGPSQERSAALRDQWHRIAGVGLTDEEWLELGEGAGASLDELDAHFSGIGASFAKYLGKTAPTSLPRAPPELTPELIAQAHSWWHQGSDFINSVDMKLEHFCSLVEHEWGVSSEMAERIDAALRSFAYRLRTAASGARMPKRNDGADLRQAGCPAASAVGAPAAAFRALLDPRSPPIVRVRVGHREGGALASRRRTRPIEADGGPVRVAVLTWNTRSGSAAPR